MGRLAGVEQGNNTPGVRNHCMLESMDILDWADWPLPSGALNGFDGVQNVMMRHGDIRVCMGNDLNQEYALQRRLATAMRFLITHS
jgi:hypothetical protein